MGKKRGIIASPQMTAITQQAEQVRARLVAAQQAAAAKVVEGASSDESVKVSVAGDMTVKSVTIDPAAAGDVARLETMVAEALSDAVAQVTRLRSGSTGGVDVSSLQLGGTPITG